jgi:cell division protein FtsQ
MYLGKTKIGTAGRNTIHRPLGEGGAGWFQRLWHHFWVGSIIVMILAGLSITLLIGYLVALSTPFFRLEDVNFQGNKQVSQVELLQKGGLEDKLNILSLNLGEVKKKMETIPWVKSVQLRRELPNKLLVLVQERQPLSLVLVNGGLYFLDREGLPFKKFEERDGVTLPVLTGLHQGDWQENGRLTPNVLQEISLLSGLLAQGRDPLYPDKLSEIHYDPECGYSLYTLDYGIRITLGHDDFQTKMARLEKVWLSLQKRQDLFNLRGISLQYGQRIVVHGLRGAAGGKKG